MAALDWSQCSSVESIPDKVGGAWVFRGTRMIPALLEVIDWEKLDRLLEQQGQRSLSRCYSKDFQHEVFAPPATVAFQSYTFAARMLLQQ